MCLVTVRRVRRVRRVKRVKRVRRIEPSRPAFTDVQVSRVKTSPSHERALARAYATAGGDTGAGGTHLGNAYVPSTCPPRDSGRRSPQLWASVLDSCRRDVN
jgi:hypothetical protein